MITIAHLSPRRHAAALLLLALATLAFAGACGDDKASGAPGESGSGGAGASAPVGDAQAAATRVASAVAAGQAAAGAARAGGIDPCTLLTLDEARAANGPDLRPGVRKGSECQFQNEIETRLVAVTLGGSRGGVAFETTCESFPGERLNVAGLGDRACIVPPLRTILVLKGDQMLSVQIVNPVEPFDAGLRDRLTDLVTKALARL